MLGLTFSTIFFAALASAFPIYPRLTTLDVAATQQAQQRDNTATRAFTGTEIKTSDGRCLFVQNGSGDFRNNLNPIQVGNCDGSQGQKWDVITKGIHNDQPGVALLVNDLTQACLNFDPRRAAGNTVIMFSCGGRADGEGVVTDSQLFPFTGGAGPLTLAPAGSKGAVCLTVSGNVIDQAACNNSAGEKFTFGDAAVVSASPALAASSTTPAPQAPTPPPQALAPAPPSTSTGPIPVSRAGGVLNPTAAAESNRRDNTATRALTGVPIKTSNGQCLSINPFAGDFRELLIPIEVKPCDGSAGQNFDVLTTGIHNNKPGNALIVSSLTQGCFNFDDRRTAGDRVIIFSCGGRADGGGVATDSQLFPFSGAANALPLAPLNGQGRVCFAQANGRLVDVACDSSNSQIFTFGNGPAAAPAPSPSPSPPAKTTSIAAASASTPTKAPPAPAPAPPATPTGPIPVSRAGGVLNPTAAAEANRRDNTATRALTGVPIKTSNGQCLSINPFAGDFRQLLIPIEVKPCDGSAGQNFDVLTTGIHNNKPGNALIVSSLTQGCFNFDDRRTAGDRVIIFSCGGRADGGGVATDSQLFPFSGAANALPLAPLNGQGRVCFAQANGKLVDVACDSSNSQIFTFGNGPAANPAPAPAPPAKTTTLAAAAAPAPTKAPPSSAPAPPATPTGPIPVSRAGGVLNPTAAAEANRRDNTATRAATGVEIKTSDGQCLSVNPFAGDFRQLLIPVEVKACDGSAGQKFDVITKGIHNDKPGNALIVSSLTQGCVNFDDRRTAGDRVILFSCGGRADGSGQVTDSQLFPFTGATTIPLAPLNGRGSVCLSPSGGKLVDVACNSASPAANQVFTIGN